MTPKHTKEKIIHPKVVHLKGERCSYCRRENEWKKGYDLGCQNALRENNVAIKMGKAIMDILDDRYEFKEEDY